MKTIIYMVRHGQSPKLADSLGKEILVYEHRKEMVYRMEFSEEKLIDIERLWKV
ncbi:hypothetical protein GCM10023310_46080 [Paenibacillus vulneris]|uniref:Phosphoglycerate mutase n=1 Tax=Paenibacillus vulneris TaxID=1133364 RepID=A0ABW3UDY0_9BACL